MGFRTLSPRLEAMKIAISWGRTPRGAAFSTMFSTVVEIFGGETESHFSTLVVVFVSRNPRLYHKLASSGRRQQKNYSRRRLSLTPIERAD